jgi:Mce-associated membrane protein
MSSSDGPIRRRRIAGESKPAAPAKKVIAKKAPTKKPAAKKAPAVKAPAKVTVAKPAAITKSPATSVAPRASVAPRPPVPAPRRVEGGDGGAAGFPRRELWWLVPSTLLAVVALVAGGWFAEDQISNRDSSDKVTASNAQAARAAGSAAQTIFSYTYDKLPEHLTASKALMTKAFGKKFDKIAPALTELAPQRKIQVQAVAREAGALPCGDNCSTTKANILVFVDQARLVGNSKEPTVFGNRITVSMVKQHGSWLVADIRAL